ncbi:MAG: ATP cone domain-containing protein [bacterium]
MSIPNTVVKFVNRDGDIEQFDRSKIADALEQAIRDIEDSRLNLPERRAHSYANEITDKIYREYYDIDWILPEFVDQYISYDPEERNRRMDQAFITERVSFVLLETFKDAISSRNPSEHQDELLAFIHDEIDKTDIDQDYTHTLFPDLSDDELDNMAAYLQESVLEMASTDLEPRILCPTRQYIQDTIEKELKKMGEVDLAEGYMIYREGRKKIREGELSELQFTSNGVHDDVVRRTNKWNIDHQCHTIFELNRWVKGENGRNLETLIESSEQRFYSDIRSTGEEILNQKDHIKVVIIAGPSCSNKTTASIILGQELEKEGLSLKPLPVDDYFHDLEKQPKDKHGDYDFEMPSAIEMSLLNEHLEDLIGGNPIDKPIYSFEEGERVGTERFECRDDEIILIDSLHGLYRSLTESVPQRSKFKIYIESMNVLRDISGNYTQWADVRLLKRMIRDMFNRGYSMEETLSHWPYVRKGELKHIIPYIYSTDAVINSGMPYELPVLKTAIGDRYPDDDFVESLKDKERRAAYIRGKRTRDLLDTTVALPDNSIVPDDSPLREFIGGSSLDIPHNE